MTEFIKQPFIRIEGNEFSLSFEQLDKFENKVFYEDQDLFIDLNSIKRFRDYLNIDDSERRKFNFQTNVFNNSRSNFTYLNKQDAKDAQVNRFHHAELGCFYFVKDYFPNNFTLKDYQQEGIQWLQDKNFRLLADDMGLGKTAQSITAATALFKQSLIRHVLIICPRSLMTNWVDELKIWANPFKSIEVHSEASDEQLWKKLIGHAHFFIINYDQLRKIPIELEGFAPDLIIADEAHKLRKASSLIHQKLFDLSKLSNRFWALTGTPIEKNVDDLINIMKVVNPNSFTPELSKLSNTSIKGYFKKDFLRRLKNDVLNELDPPEEKTFFLELNANQRKFYDQIRKSMFLDLDRSKALKYFNELRQICDVFKSSGTKIEFCIDLIHKISNLDEKVVIFSFSLNPLYALQKKIINEFDKEKSLIYEGDMSSVERSEAIKKFKSSKKTTCLLCSGKIASEGLNLTEANHVIFLNEWWNPSSNMQAQDRVLRIGQTKQVNIYKLRTKNTVEQSLDVILKSKKDINLEVIEKMVRGNS
tara:strand:- start:935 stop:2530 length:1596 start_codon:yes stop_codon:yes gene_type:complete